MISSRRKFKVLVRNGKLPLTSSPNKFPHFPACVCCPAAGFLTKPLIILANKGTLSSLEEHIEEFHFASSITGWMNRDIFYIWCIMFVCEISTYRLTLPEEIRSEHIVLVVDGHSSRGHYYSSKLLSLFGIILLVLPGHTNHVLQPFDVGLASPLKTAFAKYLLNNKLDIEEESILMKNTIHMTSKDTRNMMLTCFRQALDEITTCSNIQSSFQADWIAPVDKEHVLLN